MCIIVGVSSQTWAFQGLLIFIFFFLHFLCLHKSLRDYHFGGTDFREGTALLIPFAAVSSACFLLLLLGCFRLRCNMDLLNTGYSDCLSCETAVFSLSVSLSLHFNLFTWHSWHYNLKVNIFPLFYLQLGYLNKHFQLSTCRFKNVFCNTAK